MTEKTENTAETTPARTKNVLDMNFIEASQQNLLVTDTGRILHRKHTKLSAKEQRRFTRLVKQGRNNLTAK
jgi:ribosomal protein S18